jgi:UDP-N-acetylmuramoyl-L-alanyl-D-glutamate--2,6-diaminopimelate ligase
MRIEEILKKIEIVSVKGDISVSVSGIEFDSRNVTAGSLFVAVKGNKSDGHEFIDSAIRSGAVAIICETVPVSADKKTCWIKVTDSARALGQAASNFYGNPSSSLKLVGVTGTNGKTTIATLLYNMFIRLGYKCGLFSTVCNYINAKELPATHTTPRSCPA